MRDDQPRPHQAGRVPDFINASARLYSDATHLALVGTGAPLPAAERGGERKLIPRVLHHTYKTADSTAWPVPSWKESSDTCKRINPDWAYR